jgi:Protein of unknown function (DUF3431)
MIRKAQKPLGFLNLIFFGTASCLILYFNLQPATSKTSEWTTIRVKTISKTLPRSRDNCPGLANSKKPALVVARIQDEDAFWLDDLFETYHLCICTADAPLDESLDYLQVPANRGHEAMAYLTFMIDNYEHVPAACAVFLHGSRFAWHKDGQDYDNRAILAALNVSSALAPLGYRNLCCDWSTSTCSPSSHEP